MKDISLLIRKLPVWVGLVLCLTACSNEEDDYTYPSLLNEFADAVTDPSAHLFYLLTDKGEQLPVVNAGSISTEGVTPDTTYRALVNYALAETDNGKSGAHLYGLQVISAPHPRPAADFEEIKADPLEMQSIWRGGNYLNLILLVKAQQGKHLFHFIEDSLTVSASTGQRTLHLRLYHDAGDDVQAYTQKSYLSLPLSAYAERLSEGDLIELKIPTTQGWQPWVRGY